MQKAKPTDKKESVLDTLKRVISDLSGKATEKAADAAEEAVTENSGGTGKAVKAIRDRQKRLDEV